MEYAVGLIAVVAIAAFFVGRSSVKAKNTREWAHDAADSGYYEDDGDFWEGGMWEASNPKKISTALQISYTDGQGRNTDRVVNIREFDDKLYGGIFLGLCELRSAHRTFRYDRVRSCVDLTTGEVVSDVKQHLNQLYDESPERSVELLVSDYLDVLKVLYFVAKADGQYRKEEKTIIAEYVRALVRDDRIDEKMIDEALANTGVPTMHKYKLALGRVFKGGQIDPKKLGACCADIVVTQKKIHPMEQEAIDYFEKKLAEFRGSNAMHSERFK